MIRPHKSRHSVSAYHRKGPADEFVKLLICIPVLLEHGELHEVVLGDAPDCFDCVELARVGYIFKGPEVSLHNSHRLV